MTIRCITIYGSSNILLQTTAPFGVITNYVEKLLQITAGITNCGVITIYIILTTLSLSVSAFSTDETNSSSNASLAFSNHYFSFCGSYFIVY